MKITPTYWARIYVACKPHCSAEEFRAVCQEYVDKVGLCVSVTPTEFVYSGGVETGFIVGLINYPRFPSQPDKIRKRAKELAQILKRKMAQKRVSIEFPDETWMIGHVG